jgi:hypothetical protein
MKGEGSHSKIVNHYPYLGVELNGNLKYEMTKITNSNQFHKPL